MIRRAPALLLIIASCDASVRLGSIGSESPAIEPADAAATDANSNSDSRDAAKDPISKADSETFVDASDDPSDASDATIDSGDAGRVLTLATGMPGAEWIAVDDAHVTWTTSGRSGTANDLNGHYVSAKDGSNRIELKTEPGILRGVVIDGPNFDSLRWISPVSLIERASATQSMGPQIAGVFREGFGMAFDQTYLYAAATTKVARIEKTAEAGTATLLLASFSKAVAIVNDGTELYVADQGINRVARVDKATGDIPWSHDIGGAINDVTVDATRVYFAGGGRAGSVLKTGGGLSVFDLPGANALALDSSGIYYLTKTAVLHAEIATPSVTTTLASGFVSLGRVVLDADAIYFTDSGAGAVYRLRK